MTNNNTKQALWVGIGSLCSFGFTIASSIILSRYFSKADYGTYKQVVYVYNTMLVIFTLGLPKTFSFFLPRIEPSQAKSLIRKITLLFFLLGGVFSVLLFLLSQQIALFLKNPDLKIAIKIFSPVPFLLLPTMGLEGILATYQKTMFLAFYNICVNAFKLLCVALPVMMWNLGYKEALLGFVLASFITFLLALYLKYYPVRNEKMEECDITYKSIFQFSIPLLTASIWGIIINSADQFFISRFFGKEVFAEFSNGSFELPVIGMIISACATVLSPVFSRMSYESVNPQKDIFPLWINVTDKAAKLIYPLVIYCLFFANNIMILMYGAKYETSFIFFRFKLIIDFFRIIAFGPLMINTGKVKEYSQITMITAILVVLLEYVGVSLIASPYTISLVSLFCQIIQILACFYVVSKYFNVVFLKLFPWRTIIHITLPSAFVLMGESLIFQKMSLSNDFMILILSFLFYSIAYLFIIKLFRLDYLGIILPLLPGKSFLRKLFVSK